MHDGEETTGQAGADTAQVYTVKCPDGKIRSVVIPQHIHYAHRGPELAHLSLFEWVAIIVVLQVKEVAAGTEETEDKSAPASGTATSGLKVPCLPVDS
jgi:hypothetical protein